MIDNNCAKITTEEAVCIECGRSPIAETMLIITFISVASVQQAWFASSRAQTGICLETVGLGWLKMQNTHDKKRKKRRGYPLLVHFPHDKKRKKRNLYITY